MSGCRGEMTRTFYNTKGPTAMARQPRTHGTPGPSLAAGIVIGMLAMVAIPGAITLHTVVAPGKLAVGPNPSPHGYTWSLLMFIVPIVAISGWLLPSEGLHIPRRAFGWTVCVLTPIGWGLDIVFARWFFCFPNHQAVLGIPAPALGHPVPIEEYVFYFTGFTAVLLLYTWFSEYWLAAYTVEDYAAESRSLGRLLQFHPTSLIAAVGLISAGVVYRKWFSGEPTGWPGYFIVLVAGGLVPAMSFYPAVRRFINWRALSLTMFIIMLISLMWEATLAVPYGWWTFQHRAMLGVFIGAWSDLPMEEIFVWIAVTYATVIVFEAVKIWLASEKSAREAFLGSRSN
jgi:hypothetical protein